MKPSMPAPDDADVLFRELCSERGGLSALSVLQIAILKSMSAALVGNESPGTIAKLAELIPPARPNEVWANNYDLGRLSERELNWFGHLLERAAGRKPLSPRERRTQRESNAIELAKLIDTIESSFDASKMPNPRYVTEAELASIKTMIHNLVCCLATRGQSVHMLWEREFRSALWGPMSAKTASPELADVPTPDDNLPQNVLAMTPRPTSIHDLAGAPLKLGNEPWRTL